MQSPILVLTENTKRESGRKAQRNNIAAAKAVCAVVRTALGPRAMLKMILDQTGGIVLTNDGNSILRELEVSHPAGKSMIELSKTQDEEVGDGTTSVIILAGEMLTVAEPYLERNMHPTIIIRGFFKARDDALEALDKLALKVDISKSEEVINIIKSCLSTKFVSRWMDLMCNLAYEAVSTILVQDGNHKEIDIKRYVKVEKVPGGEIEDSYVLQGAMLNKDVLHSKMRRRIENPRILLLDCPLEYTKGENNIVMDITKDNDWTALLKAEEEWVKKTCDYIIALKPDLVITEKGISDLVQHYFVKNNITALRRLRKTDNNRIARATGATIVSRVEEAKESDMGTKCGLFEVRKIGDEYFSFIENCKEPKACTILLRGASKDVLKEIERNLQDATSVTRNILLDPRLCPGGGASEMTLSQALREKSKAIEGVEQWPYIAVANALEVIPRTLAENCGASVVRVLTELRAKHAEGKNPTWGIDGVKGTLADMMTLGVFEPYSVKAQTIKTSIEAACLLLRVDDVVSGMKKKDK